MSKLWEVDPETRAKLLDIQKQNGNNICVDCSAPSPQWASPKLGIFMCLNCSGIHRGLGVHISFIRSVTMDSFKVSEIRRMQLGGNRPWQEFFNKHKDNQLEGRTFEDATIKERYDSGVGEEWKERLSAKVEEREYVPGQRAASTAPVSRSQTPAAGIRNGAMGSPQRTASPGIGGGKKAQNEAYFAKMGEANASRPEDLHPSQGGRFAGFGSEPAPARSNGDDWFGEMTKDPMAGLTKGFGWLGKTTKSINDAYVKPNLQKLAEADLARQAQLTAAQLGKDLQTTTSRAGSTFNRFVEGESTTSTSRSTRGGAEPENKDFWESFGEAPQKPEKADFWDSFGEAPKGPPKEKAAFWDNFADAGADATSRQRSGTGSGNIGTAAMKKPAVGEQGLGKKDDDWGEGW